MAVYKKREFNAFIRTIKKGQIAHWQDIARAIGVDENTITRWKETPEAQAAINEGIADALEQMQLVGKRDWRMWQEKLKMLGVNPANKLEHTGKDGDPIETIINKYGNSEGVDEVPRTVETEERPPQDNS